MLAVRWYLRYGLSYRDVEAEFEQFALDPAVTPARVLPRHPLHQLGDDVVDRWAAWPVRVGPPPAHEVAMPGTVQVSTLCAASPNARHTRDTVDCDIPRCAAMDRVDQCVASRGVVSSVAVIRASTCASDTVRGRPGRGWSH